MTLDQPPIPPKSGTNVLTKDPVRIVWVAYSLVQSVVIILATSGVIGHTFSYAVTGIALACYVAVSELFVHHETVPLQPLLDLARAQQMEASDE